MSRSTHIIVVFIQILFVLNHGLIYNECPDIITYTESGNDSWKADIKLNAFEQELDGVSLHVQFDRDVHNLATNFEEVTTIDNQTYIIKDTNRTIEANATVNVSIEVFFDANTTVPRLLDLKLNNQTICSNISKVSTTTVTVPNLVQNDEVALQCGIVGKKGVDYPWNIALFYFRERRKTYLCGGSLISERYVLTGARCVYNNDTLRSPKELIVTLGLLNIQKRSEFSIDTFVDAVTPHAGFKQENLVNDIAIVKMSKTIAFDEYISPICLWSGGPRKTVTHKIGQLVGWGYDDEGYFVNQLWPAKMPVVNKQDCIYSNPQFFSSYTSRSTFCAGFRNATFLCLGGGGAGLNFDTYNLDGKNVWEIRGVLSNKPVGEMLCFPKQYTVFTDVAYYVDWINNITEHTIIASKPTLQLPQCGKVAVQIAPLIKFGTYSKEGEWPWHIALFLFIGKKKVYICGGSLISEKHVLTASHCVHDHINKKNLRKPEDLSVSLGLTNLKKRSEFAIDRLVTKIAAHSQYDHHTLMNDIAVLTLSEPIVFVGNIYVRPICLWSGGIDKSVVEKLGTVAGWGLDETDQYVPELKEVEMPVIDQLECIYSHREFFSRVVSNTSFCAGFRNGSSVCNGDSGGGMVFNTDNSSGEKVWEIRGIVSLSVRSQESYCDPKHYTVFTDIAFYVDWIYEKMQL